MNNPNAVTPMLAQERGAAKPDPFSVVHLITGMNRRSARGALVTLAAQALRFALTLGSTAILARLLAPSDFGLVAMVLAVTGFIAVFRDMGLSAATVQCEQIDHAQLSTLFWANTLTGLVLAVITVAAAWPISWFYGEGRLVSLTMVLSIGFLFSGITVQHQALLKRQMSFGALAGIEISAQAVGIIVGVTAASLGARYWSIPAMQISSDAATAIASWRTCPWTPGRPSRLKDVKEHLVFGGNLTGFGVLNYFSRNLDNVIVGRFCGASALGLYSRAYSLMLLPIGQIVGPLSRVVVPALSRLQSSPAAYRDYYLRALKITMYLVTPLTVCLAVMSDEVVALVLGRPWMGVSLIFRILAIGAWLQPVCATAGWLFTSSGRTDKMARWAIFSAPLTVASFFVGVPFGPAGVATSYTVCTVLLSIPLWWYTLDGSPIKWSEMVQALANPSILAVVCGLTTACLRHFFEHAPLLMKLFLSLVPGLFLATALTAAISRSARQELSDLLRNAWRALRNFQAQAA